MSERLERSATEEVLTEPASVSEETPSLETLASDGPAIEITAQTDARPQAETPVPPVQNDRTISWLRLAYCFVFLLAILAIFTFWSEVGGQGHLDLMPWYTKMISVLVSAWCCVRLTAGIVEQRSVWNRRTVAWLAGLILILFVMAAITYYYHLQEDNQPDSDENTATAMTTKSPRWMPRLAE